jgi:hypothetical protein
METNPFVGRCAVMLERTPGVLRAMLADTDAFWTDIDYGPGTWSAKEIVAHLIFAEQTNWMPRIRAMLAHADERPLLAFDRAGHAPLLERHALKALLDLFENERNESLRSLKSLNLTAEHLSRRAQHPALGPVALGNLIAAWTVHDLNHVSQITKSMAYQLKDDVGAWKEYLSILAPPSPR